MVPQMDVEKYICKSEMWILSVLVFTYRLIIDRCINYPFHGRIKIDVINGSGRSYLRKIRMIGTM